MMFQSRIPLLGVVSLLIAIGCGGGKPSDASATTDPRDSSEPSTIQLAQAVDQAAQPSGGGAGSSTIHGQALFQGSAPEPTRIKMDADPQCALQHKEAVHQQNVVVNPNGTLQHVFVYIKAGLEGRTFPTSTQPVSLDQHSCLYTPHVFGIQTNQPLEIINSDSTLHNVNCKPTKSKPFNLAQPMKGMKTRKTFTAPEIMVKCACNVHPWMAAYIGVLEHPYFSVTGEDGRFTLAGLPAGQYTVEAWHETYGVQTQTVSVGEGATQQCDFTYKAQ